MRVSIRSVLLFILLAALVSAAVRSHSHYTQLRSAYEKQGSELEKVLEEAAELRQQFSVTHPDAVFMIRTSNGTQIQEIPHSRLQEPNPNYFLYNANDQPGNGNVPTLSVLVRFIASSPIREWEAGNNVYEVIWSDKVQLEPCAKTVDFSENSRIVKTGMGRQRVGTTEHYIIELDDGPESR